jgi:aspartyl protease family protein
MNHELPHGLKITAVWLLAGLALFFGVKAWQHHQQQTRFSASGGAIEIRRGADGHYHWPGTINGRPVEFLIDTGATGTAISIALARELGLESTGDVQSMTAAGPARGEQVRADVELRGGVRAERLRIIALPGLGDRPLLGMNVLGRLRWQQQDGVMRIEPGSRPDQELQ